MSAPSNYAEGLRIIFIFLFYHFLNWNIIIADLIELYILIKADKQTDFNEDKYLMSQQAALKTFFF